MTDSTPAPRCAPGGERFVIVTGGPGSGKTTLIDELRRRGHAVTAEAGRAIIKDQVIIDGPALPWADPALFAEAMLSWEIRTYRNAEHDAAPVVFFDRGVPDLAGYQRLLGRPVPAHIDAAIRTFRYRPRVFIAPPWPEIYATDVERTQSYDEAVRTFEAIEAAYLNYGYDLVRLPFTPVEDRAGFILARR